MYCSCKSVFFDEDAWIADLPGWSSNIVRGKMYDTSELAGRNIWQKVEQRLELQSFEGVQTDQDKRYLEVSLYRFIGLVLGQKEKAHHNSSRKCKPCEYASICRFSLA